MFRQQLSADGGVFRTEKTNARTPGVNPGDPPTVLAGEQRVKGSSSGVSGRITQLVDRVRHYAFMGSEHRGSNTAGRSRQNLALTPEHTLALWTDLRAAGRRRLGGGAQYMDSVFRNATNTAKVPSYWLVNATGVVRGQRAPDAAAERHNLADERLRRPRRRRPLHPGPGPAGHASPRRSSSSAMLIHIPDVLTAEQVAQARRLLDAAEWVDGRVTAGHQSARAKDNMQIPEGHPAARELGELILAALQRNPLFISAALPLHVFPPLFNRYAGGQSFGNHVDNAIRQVPGTAHRIRTDLSATLFLAEPDEYDGGELVVEDTYGVHSVKLPAGHWCSIRRPACTTSAR